MACKSRNEKLVKYIKEPVIDINENSYGHYSY